MGPGVDFEFGFGVIEAMNDINGMAVSIQTNHVFINALLVNQ